LNIVIINLPIVCRWVFEKYDGVRGFWNPEKKVVYSRRGNVLPLPAEIINTFPSDTYLDGELWLYTPPFPSL